MGGWVLIGVESGSVRIKKDKSVTLNDPTNI
jgi:hypothetical protein